MPLTPGTRLGPYEVAGSLGAGGMGEVYKARDTRLDRVVAIKILPERLSSDPAARARFEREARAISHLNDPHICTLHDVGREGDTDFLVMEYLEGQTLAAPDRERPAPDLRRRALRPRHRRRPRPRAPGGHRPPGSQARQHHARRRRHAADFGRGQADGLRPRARLRRGSRRAALTGVATMARPVTAEGTIVGTLHYMAPEQLEGRETDARADVWALGCVLYEMATGRRAFEGASQASLIAAIIDREPEPMSRVQPLSPPALEHVVARCLAKDPGERWQSARDAAHELEWLGASGATSLTPTARAASRMRVRERLGWGLAVVTLAAALVAAVLVGRPRDPSAAGPELLRFPISAPEVGTVVADGSMGVISPDGTRFVLAVADDLGTMRLWIRRLDTLKIHPLAGTENAFLPFWSPDSRRVGFFAAGYLWQVSVDGGTAARICAAPDGRGGSWNRDGTILFAPGLSGVDLQRPVGWRRCCRSCRSGHGARRGRGPVPVLPARWHALLLSGMGPAPAIGRVGRARARVAGVHRHARVEGGQGADDQDPDAAGLRCAGFPCVHGRRSSRCPAVRPLDARTRQARRPVLATPRCRRCSTAPPPSRSPPTGFSRTSPRRPTPTWRGWTRRATNCSD